MCTLMECNTIWSCDPISQHWFLDDCLYLTLRGVATILKPFTFLQDLPKLDSRNWGCHSRMSFFVWIVYKETELIYRVLIIVHSLNITYISMETNLSSATSRIRCKCQEKVRINCIRNRNASEEVKALSILYYRWQQIV